MWRAARRLANTHILVIGHPKRKMSYVVALVKEIEIPSLILRRPFL
jgi:hypothetical protein